MSYYELQITLLYDIKNTKNLTKKDECSSMVAIEDYKFVDVEKNKNFKTYIVYTSYNTHIIKNLRYIY